VSLVRRYSFTVRGTMCSMIFLLLWMTEFLAISVAVNSSIVTSGAQLTTSPQTVTSGLTDTLTVNCSFATHGDTDFRQLVSLILSKADYSSQTYTEIATITATSSDTPHLHNSSLGAKVTGQLSLTKGNGFLCLEIANPGPQTTGEYHCEAFGFEYNGHPRVSTASNQVFDQELTTNSCLSQLRNLSVTHDRHVQELSEARSQLVSVSAQFSQCSEHLSQLQTQNDVMKTLLDIQELKNATYNNHTYVLTGPIRKNITRSDMLCGLLGGYVVEINDKAEFDFVYDFVVTKNKVYRAVLGVTDEKQEGVWEFLRSGGPAYVYSKTDGDGGDKSNCLEIWNVYHGMVDEPCFGIGYSARSVVCECPS